MRGRVPFSSPNNGKYLIFGGGVGMAGAVSFEKEVTVAAGSTVLETSITSAGALGTTIDFGTLAINWRITHLGQDTTYQSGHRTYVTGFPASGHFETVLDIGCRNAKGLRPADPGEPEPDASNRDRQVVDAIWEDFANNLVYRMDGTIMKYSHAPGYGHSAAEMLAHAEGRGQCTAWAELLTLTLEAQGFSSTRTRIDPPGDKFAVRAMPAQGSNGANYLPGTLAQGGFSFHQVVRVAIYPDRIYDPSYGGLTIKTDARSVELKYEDDNITDFWFGDPPPGRWVANVLGDPLQLRFTP